MRASFCFLYNQWCRLRARSYTRINTLGLSALLQLLNDPLAILRSGFTLSYLACYVLLKIADDCGEEQDSEYLSKDDATIVSLVFCRGLLRRTRRYLFAYWRAGVAVQCITSLWSFEHFQRLNLATLLWTLPFSMLFMLILPCTLILLICASGLLLQVADWLWSSFAGGILFVLDVALTVLEKLLSAGQHCRLSIYASERQLVLIWVVFLLIIFCHYVQRQLPIMTKVMIRLSVGLVGVLIIAEIFFYGGWNKVWQFYQLDVGQGNSAILISPDNKTLLIDGGKPGQGEKTLIPALNYLGIDHLDAALITHLHADHYGGVIDLLPWGKVDKVILPKYSTVKEDFADLIEQRYPDLSVQPQVIVAKRGDDISLGTEDIAVLYPSTEIADSVEDLNDTSLVLLIDIGVKMMLTGDLTARGEEYLLAQGEDLHCAVLQVPHHGSTTSSTEDFLQATAAEYGIISVGKNNYGHPNPDVLARLQQQMHIWRTDRDGAILLTVADGRLAERAWLFAEPLLNRIYFQ